MKLINISGKIISVGKVVILPKETAEITDEKFIDNPSVNHLIKNGFLAKAEQKEQGAAQTAKVDEPAKTEAGQTAKAAKKTIKLENGKAE